MSWLSGAEQTIWYVQILSSTTPLSLPIGIEVHTIWNYLNLG
jgi:hypothetical protein